MFFLLWFLGLSIRRLSVIPTGRSGPSDFFFCSVGLFFWGLLCSVRIPSFHSYCGVLVENPCGCGCCFCALFHNLAAPFPFPFHRVSEHNWPFHSFSGLLALSARASLFSFHHSPTYNPPFSSLDAPQDAVSQKESCTVTAS